MQFKMNDVEPSSYRSSDSKVRISVFVLKVYGDRGDIRMYYIQKMCIASVYSNSFVILVQSRII